MKQQAPEILVEKDILGLEKPKNQLKHLKSKNGGWFLFVALMVLAAIAVAVYYF